MKDISICIDCDVIQADGGTRVASITGGFVALYQAIHKLMAEKKIKVNPIREFVAAVSCDIFNGEAILDVDYEEEFKFAGGYEFCNDRKRQNSGNPRNG